MNDLYVAMYLVQHKIGTLEETIEFYKNHPSSYLKNNDSSIKHNKVSKKKRKVKSNGYNSRANILSRLLGVDFLLPADFYKAELMQKLESTSPPYISDVFKAYLWGLHWGKLRGNFAILTDTVMDLFLTRRIQVLAKDEEVILDFQLTVWFDLAALRCATWMPKFLLLDHMKSNFKALRCLVSVYAANLIFRIEILVVILLLKQFDLYTDRDLIYRLQIFERLVNIFLGSDLHSKIDKSIKEFIGKIPEPNLYEHLDRISTENLSIMVKYYIWILGFYGDISYKNKCTGIFLYLHCLQDKELLEEFKNIPWLEDIKIQ